jgi:hypothetical protein
VVCFEEVKVVYREERGGVGSQEGEKKREKMERDEKEKVGVEKIKWGNRGMSELVLGHNGEGS